MAVTPAWGNASYQSAGQATRVERRATGGWVSGRRELGVVYCVCRISGCAVAGYRWATHYGVTVKFASSRSEARQPKALQGGSI
jgi:hypothetical protein